MKKRYQIYNESYEDKKLFSESRMTMNGTLTTYKYVGDVFSCLLLYDYTHISKNFYQDVSEEYKFIVRTNMLDRLHKIKCVYFHRKDDIGDHKTLYLTTFTNEINRANETTDEYMVPAFEYDLTSDVDLFEVYKIVNDYIRKALVVLFKECEAKMF